MASRRSKVLAVVALGVAAPCSVLSQDIDPFNVGSGLLLAPPPPSELEAADPAGADGAPVDGATTAPIPPQVARLNEGTGPVFSSRVALGFIYEDEEGPEPTDTYLSGLFELGVQTDTRNQAFAFSVGAETRLGEVNGDNVADLTDPFASLDYTLFNRSTVLDVELRYREADADEDFLTEDFEDEDLISDDGTEQVSSVAVTLETGQDRRFGTVTALELSETDFTDTVNPDLIDETNYSALTEWRFSIDRRFELTLFGSFDRNEEEDMLETIETDTALGLRTNVLLNRAWTGQFEIAAISEETETTGGVVDEDGFSTEAEVTRLMRNGQLTFATSYEDVDDDTISSFEVTRSLGLANGAALSATLGIVSFDGDGLEPLFGFSYDHEFLRGQSVNVFLQQTPGENDDDEEVIRTLFNIGYNHELTRNSRLGIDGVIADIDEQNGDGTLAASLGVSYFHDLTEDWGLVARAERRVEFEDGDRTERIDRFSISLERTFLFRP